jgi:hypothetical protein
MKTGFPMHLSLLVLLLAVAVGCNPTRTDADLANEVRGKVMADPNVTSRQIQVSAESGAVTLSGAVESEMERLAAANAASQVTGVRTVVNNLTVAGAPAMAFGEPAAAPVTRASAPPATQPAAKPAAQRPTAPVEEFNNPTAKSAAQQAQPAEARVTLPAGTALIVRLTSALDSEKNKTGESFVTSLDQPLTHNDEVVVPAHARVEGRIIEARDAGHFSGRSELVLQLTRIVVVGRSYDLNTDQWSREGASRAIIGGIVGGGKGAAIGAAAGAGAGTGVQAATGGKPIRLPAEAVLTFHLEQPLSVVPAPASERRQLPVNQ